MENNSAFASDGETEYIGKQRRTYGVQFSEAESLILCELFVKYKMQLNPNSSVKEANKTRNAAWKMVADELNAQTAGIVRTKEQIKQRWKNMAKSAKKKVVQHKKEKNATGGGPRPPPLDSQTQRIYEAVGVDSHKFNGIDNAISTPVFKPFKTEPVERRSDAFACGDVNFSISSSRIKLSKKSEPVDTLFGGYACDDDEISVISTTQKLSKKSEPVNSSHGGYACGEEEFSDTSKFDMKPPKRLNPESELRIRVLEAQLRAAEAQESAAKAQLTAAETIDMFAGKMAGIIDSPSEKKTKTYRPRFSPLVQYDDEEIYKRYRFNRSGIEYILSLVEDRLDVRGESDRGFPLSPLNQLLLTLSYLASNSFQIKVGDELGVSQATASRIIVRVTKALADRVSDFIHFPSSEQGRIAIQQGFYRMKGFPGVIGCADGTHIAIRAPELSKEDAYVCRKGVGQHSINVQAVCDHNMKFLNVDCTWPGSTHDSFVMQNSAVWDAFESGRLKGIILGDSGYPLKKWLMTPLTEPKTNAERRYQAAHTSTRSTIERSFGLLKRRFSCLHSGLRMDLKNVPNIIGACFLLHNIARDMNLPDFADVDVSEIVPDTRLSQPDDSSYPKRFRDELIQNCFSNS